MSDLTGKEVLVRGPEDLADEVDLVQETVEDIGRLVDEELEAVTREQVRDDPYLPEIRDVYRGDTEREFESELERDEGGLKAADMTSVLKMQPLTSELSGTPVIYVTDRPLFAEDRQREVEKFVHGVQQQGSRDTAVLSSFAFQEMRPELQDEMLTTLAYHEGGHLLESSESDREYVDEGEFGGGHCQHPDVMTNDSIRDNTRYRHENSVYCGVCTHEIKEGIRELEKESSTV